MNELTAANLTATDIHTALELGLVHRTTCEAALVGDLTARTDIAALLCQGMPEDGRAKTTTGWQP